MARPTGLAKRALAMARQSLIELSWRSSSSDHPRPPPPVPPLMTTTTPRLASPINPNCALHQPRGAHLGAVLHLQRGVAHAGDPLPRGVPPRRRRDLRRNAAGRAQVMARLVEGPQRGHGVPHGVEE